MDKPNTHQLMLNSDSGDHIFSVDVGRAVDRVSKRIKAAHQTERGRMIAERLHRPAIY